MSDGMGREFTYLSSHATNRYFIPNWGNVLSSQLMPAETPSELNYANKKTKPYKKRTYTEVYNTSIRDKIAISCM